MEWVSDVYSSISGSFICSISSIRTISLFNSPIVVSIVLPFCFDCVVFDHNRPSKSPSIYMPNVSTSMSMTQQPSMQPQHSRAPQPPVHTQSMSQHQSSIIQSKSKTTAKLSPKQPQHSANNQQSGPKGSITHGTPVNSNNQPILIQTTGDYLKLKKLFNNAFTQAMNQPNNNNNNNTQTPLNNNLGPATLSPRFDGIGMRQTPPSGDKLGSITQGTPVHMPPHHLTDKRVYEYCKYTYILGHFAGTEERCKLFAIRYKNKPFPSHFLQHNTTRIADKVQLSRHHNSQVHSNKAFSVLHIKHADHLARTQLNHLPR